MNRGRTYQTSRPNELDMYDEQPYTDDTRYPNLRKDFRLSSQRGPVANDRYHPALSDDGRWESRVGNNRDRDYERSRSPHWEGRIRYTDRDREGYRSPRRDRSRSRSPYFGAPPNRTVILEGLPPDLTQEDSPSRIAVEFLLSIGPANTATFVGLQILNELQQSKHVNGLEEVRVIKDKKTGQPRGFAFAQFTSIPEARTFLEDHYPTLSLYRVYDPTKPPPVEAIKVRIAYSRDREDREKAGKREEDWKCEVCHLSNFSHRNLCFRCNAPRTRSTAQGVVVTQANISCFSGFTTTGDSDVSPDDTGSQFLLFRGLEPGVTEELLAKGVSKLMRTKANTPSLEAPVVKKNKISSTTNDASLGAKEGSMRRVLLVRDRKTDDSWRYGFAEFNTVEDAQAAMIKFRSLDRFTIASKPVLVSYIHAGVFVPIIQQLPAEYHRFAFSPLSNASMKLMYWDEAAYASELTIAVSKQKPEANVQESETSRLAIVAAKEGLITLGKDGESRLKKRKVEKDSKAVAPHLQFWSNRHAELHGLPSKDMEFTSDSCTETSKKSKVDTSPNHSFADLGAKCCQLCRRQFKTEAEIHKHERMSQLHRDNLKDQDLVAKALTKLQRSTIQSTDNAAYRDRAKERRQAFNQPKQPVAQHNRSVIDHDEVSKPKMNEPAVPFQSKGAALLGKMGWTAGEGLGAQGTGRKEVISSELYAQGVGLGAQGGKVGDATEEAQRQTKGSYADFVNKAKDKAKERFQSLA